MPTFGKTSIGESYSGFGQGPVVWITRLTTPDDMAIVTGVSVYLGSHDGITPLNVIAGIYSDNAGVKGNLLVSSAVVAGGAAPQWYNLPITYALPPNTPVWLAVMADGNPDFYYDAGIDAFYWANTGIVFPTLPANASSIYNSGGLTSASIYATYDSVGPAWSLTISAGAGGTVNPASATGAQGTVTPTITAYPDGTHIFSNWIYDGVPLDPIDYPNPLSIIIADALTHTLQATFSVVTAQYTLTINSDPSGIPFTIS